MPCHGLSVPITVLLIWVGVIRTIIKVIVNTVIVYIGRAALVAGITNTIAV